MTKAEPPGRWSCRKLAVASAEVKIASSGTVEAAGAQARREVAAGVDRVVGEDEEGQPELAQARQEAVGARDRVLLVHEHAVHVHQPGADLAAAARRAE